MPLVVPVPLCHSCAAVPSQPYRQVLAMVVPWCGSAAEEALRVTVTSAGAMLPPASLPSRPRRSFLQHNHTGKLASTFCAADTATCNARCHRRALLTTIVPACTHAYHTLLRLYTMQASRSPPDRKAPTHFQPSHTEARTNDPAQKAPAPLRSGPITCGARRRRRRGRRQSRRG